MTSRGYVKGNNNLISIINKDNIDISDFAESMRRGEKLQPIMENIHNFLSDCNQEFEANDASFAARGTAQVPYNRLTPEYKRFLEQIVKYYGKDKNSYNSSILRELVYKCKKID